MKDMSNVPGRCVHSGTVFLYNNDNKKKAQLLL